METFRIKVEKLVLISLVPIFFIYYLPRTSGVVIFIFLSLILITGLLFFKCLGKFSIYFQQKKAFLNNLLLLLISFILSIIAIESFLWIYQLKPETNNKLTIPIEWKKKRVNISGASYAYNWHNILHVHDKNHMRRITPFPPKLNDKFRVMIVGDSLTYGYGVREEETYPMKIETALKRNFNIEVLNLGVSGYQSEDVLKIVKQFTPVLQPDLIIYGVCLNDFLPSGVGQYENNMAYPFPLPEAVKRFFAEKTQIGRMIQEAYNRLLMIIGLRNDFFTDILKDFNDYQMRFARDVKEMNLFVTRKGLPPILTLVLNQFPKLDSKGYQIALVAERYLTKAGMVVVPTEEYYRKYDKQQMVVSPWEGHPNAEAHKIFADLFLTHLEYRQDLGLYRIGR